MKFYTTAAAVFLVASVATLLGLALNSPSSAFGHALKQVRAARSMSFSQLQSDGKQLAINTKVYLAEDGRRRTEMQGKDKSSGVTTIFDSTGFIRIVLLELTKTAIVEDAKENRSINAGKMFLDWLENLKKLGDKPDQELGKKDIDGKHVTGFVATQGNFKFTMWIDDVTRELVRMEYDSPVNGAAYHITMTDFRFNEDLDKSLFSFDVPSGYKVRKQPAVPAVAGGEASIIEALRGYTKRDGGKFPASISEWGQWAVLFSKDSHDGKLDAEATRVLANLGAITPFLVSMPKENYAYLGEGMTVDQKDAIVFWYKKEDGTYRAIYADLTVKDITAEKLPKK
jgi:outer membrane lipoprotein-sorting protein